MTEETEIAQTDVAGVADVLGEDGNPLPPKELVALIEHQQAIAKAREDFLEQNRKDAAQVQAAIDAYYARQRVAGFSDDDLQAAAAELERRKAEGGQG